MLGKPPTQLPLASRIIPPQPMILGRVKFYHIIRGRLPINDPASHFIPYYLPCQLFRLLIILLSLKDIKGWFIGSHIIFIMLFFISPYPNCMTRNSPHTPPIFDSISMIIQVESNPVLKIKGKELAENTTWNYTLPNMCGC